MEKIKIITDSTSDLPISLIEKYGIEVIPLNVYFGDECYKDGVDLHLRELVDKMNETNIFPKTSQIPPAVFTDYYKKYLEQGYKIISIHLSSKMSGTYQSACIAKDMLDTEDIIVIDGNNVTAGLGIIVLKACKLAEQGMDISEIQKEILQLQPHVKSALAFESLDNLVKGGRLSKTAGFIGNILGIKVILEVKDGQMSVMDKVRGSKKATKNILQYLDKLQVKKGEIAILLNAESNDMLDTLRESLIERKIDFIESEVGCVVGTHSGLRACGIFFVENY